MLRKTIEIVNKLGLHARAAMKLTDTAARFSCSVIIHHQGRQADGKSILEVMVVGASKGHKIDIVTDGEDETEAMQALTALIDDKFGEGE